MSKVNWEKMNGPRLKKAAWYKLLWCALRHVKKYKIYSVYDYMMQRPYDVKVYGCYKCDIWRRAEEDK